MAEEIQLVPSQSQKALLDTRPNTMKLFEQQPNTVNNFGGTVVNTTNLETLNVTIQNSSIPPFVERQIDSQDMVWDKTHYNLFVTNELNIYDNLCSFVVEPSHALTDYMDNSLKAEFSTLKPEAVKRIKSFPSIFANENEDFGQTSEGQMLGYGYVRGIEVGKSGIKIYPCIKKRLRQQRFNEVLHKFEIKGSSTFNEFNTPHWSIKKLDLVSILGELGCTL